MNVRCCIDYIARNHYLWNVSKIKCDRTELSLYRFTNYWTGVQPWPYHPIWICAALTISPYLNLCCLDHIALSESVQPWPYRLIWICAALTISLYLNLCRLDHITVWICAALTISLCLNLCSLDHIALSESVLPWPYRPIWICAALTISLYLNLCSLDHITLSESVQPWPYHSIWICAALTISPYLNLCSLDHITVSESAAELRLGKTVSFWKCKLVTKLDSVINVWLGCFLKPVCQIQ